MKSTILLSFLLLCSFISIGQIPAFKWAEKIDGNIFITSVVSHGGYVYVAGTFIGTIDFDPGSGVDTLTDHGFGDIFISKMDSLGNLLWVHQIGGSSYDEADALVFDSSGNMYVTGFFSGDSVDFDSGPAAYYMSSTENTFVLKLDDNGNFIWAKQLSGIGENYSVSMAIDKANNLLVTGKFGGTADFDPGTGSDSLTSFADDIYIWKLDKNGNHIWAKQIASLPSTTRSYAIATDNANNVFVTGMLIGTTDFDPGMATFNLTHTGSLSASFILKLDASGNFVWANKIENSNPFLHNTGLLLDASDNIYFGGEFSGTVDFDPGPTGIEATATPLSNHFLLKLDDNGSFQWVRTLQDIKGIALDKLNNIYTCGTVTNKFDPAGNQLWTIDSTYGISMTIDAGNNIYTTGAYSGTVDFDPGAGTYTLSSVSSSTFVQKLGQNGVSAVNSFSQAAGMVAYPNPSQGHLNLRSDKTGTLVMVNSIGQQVKTFTIESNKLTTIDVSDLANGIYFIADINNTSMHIPVLLQH